MKAWFDNIPNRKKSKCRKWDDSILEHKFHLTTNAIPMDIADLDFSVAPAIVKAMMDRASIPDYSYSYVYDEFYDAVIAWNQRRYQIDLQKDEIRLVYGTVSALHHIVKCFCDQDESVLINTPAYDPFEEAISHGGRKMVCNPLVMKEGRYEIDFEHLEKQIKTKKVRVYIFCSPQNPSGRVWSKEELYQVAELCIKYQVLLVCDEVHRDLVFHDQTFISLWNVHPEIAKHSIVCVSANKGFNLGGLKTSYLTIRNLVIKQKLDVYLETVQVTSPNVFAIPAYIAAYNDSEMWLDEMVAYIMDNFQYLKKEIQNIFPNAYVMDNDSSFLAWIDMRKVFKTEREMTEFFIRADVSMVVGSYFVQDGEGWVRLNFGTSRAILEAAIKRLKQTYQD